MWFAKLLAGYLALLCRALQVSPDHLIKGRRGNLPPPTGGFGAF